MTEDGPPPGWLDPIVEAIGVEHELAVVMGRIRNAVLAANAPTVGALHVTCSDEAQHESHEVFRRALVEPLLPALHEAGPAPFMTANLGGRYEPGSAPIAEAHFADTGTPWKILVAQVDAHVARGDGAGAAYGPMRRYGGEAVFCEALHRVLEVPPPDRPAIRELQAELSADDVDRIALLRDGPDRTRPLLAAICHARLAARLAVRDIEAHDPVSPTLYLVVPTVTVNRPGPDEALIVGAYVCDHRGAERAQSYVGLGDRPDRYVVHDPPATMRVEDRSPGP